MSTSADVETNDGSPSGVARRAAVRGIAGALGGVAALGAVGASAKKKVKGTLVRVEIEEFTQTIPANSTDDATALCPDPGPGEKVLVLGGGFDLDSPDANLVFMRESRAADDAAAWIAEATNTSPTNTADLTAQVICGYFRK